jgi:hypothetical protein
VLAIYIDLLAGVVIEQAGLAQSVERQALNLMVEGSSPSFGVFFNSDTNYTVFCFHGFTIVLTLLNNEFSFTTLLSFLHHNLSH